MALRLAPSPVGSRRQRMVGPSATIGALSIISIGLHLRDPHQEGSWGFCPLYAATGWYCPGCGGLRAVNDLSNGHLGAALSSNLLVPLLAPVVALLLAVWAADRWRGRERGLDLSRAHLYAGAIVAVLVVFAVLRNLPGGAWLAP